MGYRTYIEWCDSSVNSSSGCDGCELLANGCYAEPMHVNRLAKAMGDLYAPDFTEVRMIAGRAAKAAAWSDLTGKDRHDKPWLNGLPRVIFSGDMGDLFSRAVTFDFLVRDVFAAVRSPAGLRHIWMFLTKQPARAADFAEYLAGQGTAWPPNAWIGTSITKRANLGRIEWLRQIPACRFASFEPLWGDVGAVGLEGIRLAIVGGESGPHARPCELRWIRSIVAQCKAAGVPCFVKQLGSNAFCDPGELSADPVPVPAFMRGLAEMGLSHPKGGDPAEWPADLRVREFPRGVPA